MLEPIMFSRILSLFCASLISTMSPIKPFMIFSSTPAAMPEMTPLPTVMRKAPVKSITPITRLFPLWRSILRQAMVSMSFMPGRVPFL